MRGAKKCRMHCQAPALRPAAPSEEWSQSYHGLRHWIWTQMLILKRLFLPQDTSHRRFLFFWGPPNTRKQRGAEQNPGGILPCKKAQVKSQYELENQSHSQMCHIFSCRKPVLEDLWVMEGLCSIAEHKPLNITCAQKWLWALPVKLLSYCIIHICFMMTQCLPCWIFYFSGSKTINYSPWQEMFSLPLF